MRYKFEVVLNIPVDYVYIDKDEMATYIADAITHSYKQTEPGSDVRETMIWAKFMIKWTNPTIGPHRQWHYIENLGPERYEDER